MITRRAVGVSVPLTAHAGVDLTSVGLDIIDVLRFGAQELNIPVTFEIRDDAGDSGRAAAITEEFRRAGVTEIIGYPVSGTALAAAPILREAGTMCALSSMASSPELRHFGDCVFRTRPSDLRGIETLAEHLRSRGVMRLAALTEEAAYPRASASALFETLIDTEILARTFRSDGAGVEAVVRDLAESRLETLFVCTQTERAFAAVLEQLERSRYRPEIVALGMPGSALFRTLAGARAAGITYVSLDDTLGAGSLSALYRSYIEKNGVPRSVDYVFSTTIAALLALDSAVRSGGAARESLRSGLVSHPAVGTFAFDAAGEAALYDFSVKKIPV